MASEDGPPPAAARVVPPEELAPHFPQLEILECLGRGGMGVVYKARQKSLNRLVALKLLAPERVGDARFALRFTREAHALAALNHPSIVTVYDFGQAGGFYFLLMEFVDGVNLRQAMKAGRFTPEQALSVVPPICEALQFAHEHGVVHRDIKPENLLLDKDGRVKIADFGIARMMGDESVTGLAETQPAGTPQYMAPEQRAHLRVDHRADIYSLGVVLYEMLTGELPADKLQPPSRKVDIDVRLDEIVLRALEAQPERRYQTAGDFRTQVVSMTARASASPVGPSHAAAPVRFSRTAIVGAWWSVFSIFAALIVIQLLLAHFGGRDAMFGVPPVFTTPFAKFLLLFLLLLGVSAPFGTTLLGWTAVSQIRRAAGKLHGLWLAVFDGVLFPLLAVDALLGFIWYNVVGVAFESLPPVWRTANAVMLKGYGWSALVILTVLSAAVADLLIIRAVWRTVLRASANPGAPPLQEKPGGLAWSLRHTAVARIVLFVAVVLAAPWLPKKQVEAGPPSAPLQTSAFGPVIERTMLAVEEGAESKGLDLDMDRLVELPAQFSQMEPKVRVPAPNLPITFAFNTVHNAGLLQITGFTTNPRAVKFRYKLVQGGTKSETVAETVGSPAFGPAIERAASDFIDLDSARLLRAPHPQRGPPAGWLEQGVTPEWLAQQGIDATWASDGLIGVGLTVIPLPNEKWSEGTAGWLLDRLASAQPPDPLTKIELPENLPATWGFKTREGGEGLLQIVGTTKDRGLIIPTIRFKLVQREPAPGELKPKTADDASSKPLASKAPPAPQGGWREAPAHSGPSRVGSSPKSVTAHPNSFRMLENQHILLAFPANSARKPTRRLLRERRAPERGVVPLRSSP